MRPKCGFSRIALQALQAHGATPFAVDVLEDEDIRNGIKDYTGWPTIPQVFIKGEFVGGCDVVQEAHRSGKLDQLLEGIVSADKDDGT